VDVRAVLCARVSGDDRSKEGRNLAGQLEMGREFALKQGWRIVAELSEDDKGARGASIELPELNRAIEMARAGEFDVLVARDLDRFARSLAKQLIIEEKFRSHGVRIEYVLGEYPDTPEGNLNKNIKAVIAEYERLKINERMRRGRRLKVKSGSVLVAGHPPFGYRPVDRDGRFHLEVYEPEAGVVRMVYQWYIEGNGSDGPVPIRTIARRLNEMGVAPPTNGVIRGDKWTPQAIRGFLKNETYAGTWTYGKTRRGKLNSSSNHLAVEVPAVIKRHTWEAAQDQLKRNRTRANRSTTHPYLLRGLISCGKCGSKVHAEAQTQHKSGIYKYYLCSALGTACDSRPANVDRVDTAVWAWIRSILLAPELLDQMLESYLSQGAAVNAPLLERAKVVENLIVENRAKLWNGCSTCSSKEISPLRSFTHANKTSHPPSAPLNGSRSILGSRWKPTA